MSLGVRSHEKPLWCGRLDRFRKVLGPLAAALIAVTHKNRMPSTTVASSGSASHMSNPYRTRLRVNPGHGLTAAGQL